MLFALKRLLEPSPPETNLTSEKEHREGTSTVLSGSEVNEKEPGLEEEETNKRRRIQENGFGNHDVDVTHMERNLEKEPYGDQCVGGTGLGTVDVGDPDVFGLNGMRHKERTEARDRIKASSILEVSSRSGVETETEPEAGTSDRPQTGSTEQVEIIDDADASQTLTKEPGIEAEESGALLTTDTVVHVPEDAPERETTTITGPEKVTTTSETATIEEQRNVRRNFEIPIDLEEDTHVQQTQAETEPEAGTSDRPTPQTGSTEQVEIIDDADASQTLTKEPGIEAEGSGALLTTDTVVHVPEDAPDQETTTINGPEKVTTTSETATIEEQRNVRRNFEIPIDLEEDTHVQQTQASVAFERQRRRAERRRNRVPEVIDLTEESTSGRSNMMEFFSDGEGSSLFVRSRVRPTGTQNEVVTIASDDEEETSPVNLAGPDTITTHFSSIPTRSNPLHIPIGLDFTIGTPANEDDDDDEKDDDESLYPNDHPSDGESSYDDPEEFARDDMLEHDGEGFDPYELEEGGVYTNSDDEEVQENDLRPSSSTSSGPPIVVGVSSTGNVASSMTTTLVDPTRAEIIILDDDDSIDRTPRPSPPRTPPPRPLTSTVAQSPQLKCSVCLDIPQLLSYTDCGHVYCEECIRAAVRVNHKCPVCREKLSLSNIRIMQPLLQFDA